MIVADANLIAYLVMPGDRTGEAEAILSVDPIWAAPLLWRSELRSVVHKYVLRKLLTLTQAGAVLQRAESVVAGRESDVDSGRVLALASRSGCSTYDCEYVALAQDLGVPLITFDRTMLRAFPQDALTPAQLLDG